MTTILIPPVTILTSMIFQNMVFWVILLQQSLGYQVHKLTMWCQSATCWYWKIFSTILHGHEVLGKDGQTNIWFLWHIFIEPILLFIQLDFTTGRENIPDTGPALILYYHGAIPVDYFYLVADTFLQKRR